MRPLMENRTSHSRLLSICSTYSPGGFEPVSAAFRNGWGDAGSPVGGAATQSWFSYGYICATAINTFYTANELFVVQSLRCVQLFATSWTAAHLASLSFTIFQNLLKLMSMESVMPSNHLILCRPLLLLPSIFPSIRVLSSELALHIRWPKCWSFSLRSLS